MLSTIQYWHVFVDNAPFLFVFKLIFGALGSALALKLWITSVFVDLSPLLE